MAVGVVLGADDGWPDGCALGCSEGCPDGLSEGLELGCDDGADEGWLEGIELGCVEMLGDSLGCGIKMNEQRCQFHISVGTHTKRHSLLSTHVPATSANRSRMEIQMAGRSGHQRSKDSPTATRWAATTAEMSASRSRWDVPRAGCSVRH